MEANVGHGQGGIEGAIPAADPGAGAPEPAPGFGIGGEEPDRPEEVEPAEVVDGDAEVVDGDAEDGDGWHEDTPFRTPDPEDVSRRP